MMMKKIRIFSVITMLMALFICVFNNNAYAQQYSYEIGYNPLGEKIKYIDSIKVNTNGLASGRHAGKDYIKNVFNSSYYRGVTVIRTRKLTAGDKEYSLVTKFIPYYNSSESAFQLYFNDKLTTEVRYSNARNISYITYDNYLNFNDSLRPEYINYSKVKVESVETVVEGDTFNMDDYPLYEDFLVVKTYDVKNVESITSTIKDLKTKEELLKTPIVLENGLKLNEDYNRAYGGNYILDSKGYIAPGKYYFKFYNESIETLPAYVFEITVLNSITAFPGFQTNVERQITEDEIKEMIESYEITEYTYDATKYYKNFDIVGTYIIDISYKLKGQDFEATLPINVSPIEKETFKIKDKSLLDVSYTKVLSDKEFENNIDFDYILLDEYSVDYSNYVSNYTEIGSYLVHVKAKDINNKIYIQSYYINVIDDIIPEVSVSDNFKTEYSYTKELNIEDIINYLIIYDKTNYEITYDNKFNNNIGKHIINFEVTDEFDNKALCPVSINIIDDISPKLIINDINVTTDTPLDENSIKGQIYAIDAIDGIINIDNITLNDIDGYKYNNDVAGTYKFEAIAKDNSGNEGHAFFNIIVSNDEIKSDKINVITLERNVRLNKEEIINYLITKGYLEANIEYELNSKYFDDEYLELDKYDLEIKNGDNISNYEIIIKDPDIKYEIEKNDNKENNNQSTIIIVVSIIGVLLTISIILIIIIYKKRH